MYHFKWHISAVQKLDITPCNPTWVGIMVSPYIPKQQRDEVTCNMMCKHNWFFVMVTSFGMSDKV